MKRRAILLMVTMTAALIVAGGMALGVSRTCPGVFPGDCLGSREADTLTGTGIADTIAGLEGNDIISGDKVFFDEGEDTVTGCEKKFSVV